MGLLGKSGSTKKVDRWGDEQEPEVGQGDVRWNNRDERGQLDRDEWLPIGVVT